jgi:hypothetical protein
MTILMRNSIPIENGILTFLRLQNNVRSEMSAVEWTGVFPLRYGVATPLVKYFVKQEGWDERVEVDDLNPYTRNR